MNTINQAQINMLKQQLRTWHLPSDDVLNVIAKTPRNLFVPKPFESLAFTDIPIPLNHQQFMLTPKEEAWMLDALLLKPSHRVLEIGTGSGYFTALLARMALAVDTVDIFSDFTKEAEYKLNALGLRNVQFITEDALSFETVNTYDAVVITGSLPSLPKQFCSMVTKGGCLLAIVGVAPVMTALQLNYTHDRNWQEVKLFETMVAPLIHAPSDTLFRF